MLAQNNRSIALDLLDMSMEPIRGSLPYDMGSITLTDILINEENCEYRYQMKDADTYAQYKARTSEVKENLKKVLSSMQPTLAMCIDANIGLKYTYISPSTVFKVSVLFSVEELRDILGEPLTKQSRDEIIRKWLTATFVDGLDPMLYKGMNDKHVLFSLQEDNNSWKELGEIDKFFLMGFIQSSFDEEDSGMIYPLTCLYLGRGEDITIINSKTKQRKNCNIPYEDILDIYKDFKANGSLVDIEPLPQSVYEAPNVHANKYKDIPIKPLFQGKSADSFSSWANSHLHYPEKAINRAIQGTVVMGFRIGPDGSITDVKIIQGVHKLLDKEAYRVVCSSPKWEPGKLKDGTPVAVWYTFPIVFALN